MTYPSDGLIAKLEAAAEGCRKFDGEIWRAIEPDDGQWWEFEDGWAWRDPSDGGYVMAPPYTTSIDAALPGEQIEMVSIQRAPPGLPQKWSALEANWPRNADGHYTCMRVAGIGHTEALARRIAALRARQA